MELGAAGEDVGLDRLLKTNTATGRTLSRFRQGLRWYPLLPDLPTARHREPMKALDERGRGHPVFRLLVGVVGG